MTDLVADARRLAALGLGVFPIRSGRKSPALTGWQQRATTDPDEAERLLAQYPGCNLGVATGERSGFFVLDVDTKSADGWLTMLELEFTVGILPKTWLADTPSGGGHYYLRYPEGRRIGNRASFRPGLDIRGEGGLVVAPPSVTAVGAYRWRVAPWEQAIADAPDWLLDLACAPATATALRPSRRPPIALAGDLAGIVTEEARRQFERVADAAYGTRNDTLFKAAAILGELVGAGVLRQGLADVGLELAAEECGLVREDGLAAVRATIDSGLKAGMAQPRAIAR